MTQTYCMKCKKKTDDDNPHIVTSKGRTSRKSKCSICGTSKTVFVKSQGGGYKMEAMPKVKLIKHQSGGNPALLAALPKIAESGANVGKALIDNVGNAFSQVRKEGFDKAVLTGRYDRKADQNRRRQLKRDYQFAERMSKKYGGKLSDYL